MGTNKHLSRKSIRLKGYDYSNPNWYYVTICTENRVNWFGKVINTQIILSEIGKKIIESWEKIPEHFNYCELDYYVVMPNHLHGIIIINDHKETRSDDCRGVQLNAPTRHKYFSKISPPKGSLGVIIRTFKGAVKKYCNESRIEEFKWQRCYYDHIIRNDNDLHRIRTYIQNNPLKWELDEYYKQ